jgi:hypothetical protein
MYEIEIVNHEVQNHAHVSAATGPRTKPPTGNFLGHAREFEESRLGEDEAFLMADGQDLSGSLGERDQRIGLIDTRRDRFLDEDMRTRIQKGADDRRVRACGRTNADNVDVTEELSPVSNGANSSAYLEVAARIRIRVGDGNELDT